MTPIEKDQIIEQELAQVRKELAVVDGLPGDVERVLRCLREHLFEESCNVNAILECSGGSKASIRARFKYHVGMKIHEYLTDQRMRVAIGLLQHDALEIGVIAFSVGYANYRTFDRVFKRYTGCTPTEYREKMSSENVQRKCPASYSTGWYPPANPHALCGIASAMFVELIFLCISETQPCIASA